MKRYGLLFAALMAITACAGVLATSAFALPELLGFAGLGVFTGGGDAPEGQEALFETTGGEKLHCPTASLEGKQETDTLGVFHVDLSGCESGGFKCNSTGDAAGVILVLGNIHYVFDQLGVGAELGVAVLIEPEEVAIKCTALVTLKLKGRVLCLILEPLTSELNHLFHGTQAAGVQNVRRYWDDNGNEVGSVFLLMNKNGGGFVQTGLMILMKFTFANLVSFMNE